MAKIRIPRKKRKLAYFRNCGHVERLCFPCVPKVIRYFSYVIIRDGMKRYNCTAEDLCKRLGRYTKDDYVWYHWERKKYLGIEPKISEEFQEYWDYFVNQGVIKIK